MVVLKMRPSVSWRVAIIRRRVVWDNKGLCSFDEYANDVMHLGFVTVGERVGVAFFTARSSLTPVSWLGSHTESVIAAMSGVCYRYCTRKSEPHLLPYIRIVAERTGKKYAAQVTDVNDYRFVKKLYLENSLYCCLNHLQIQKNMRYINSGSLSYISSQDGKSVNSEDEITGLKDELDRFIPNRSAMDFDYAHYMLTVANKGKKNPVDCSPEREAYKKLLAEACNMNRFGILAFKNKPPTPIEAIPRYFFEPLPVEVGELGPLQIVYMRGCTGLHELPSSVKGPLEVVCDTETSLHWINIPNVKLKLVEEDKIDEGRRIATKLNRLREEILIVCEKRRNLADELRSIRGIVVVGKAAEFITDTLRKDNAQVAQLREVESQMEFRALEKDLFVQKLVGNIESIFNVGAEEAVGGRRNWLDMMIVYLQKFTDEHRDFALSVNRLLRDMNESCLDRRAFVRELRSMSGEIVPARAAVFLEEMMDKEGNMEWQLRELGKEAREMASEIEAFLLKLMDEEPSH
ncbi:cell division cycle 20.2, cofactor of APC complex-like protein [Tanacetum coccineum]|uniref:Cell division cycle 20.2, cofactor of APC complex-like protein n=1 Tax=Tanacetum coccineum TaxID=301880 RepID=A0ABQ4YAA9_9ASTR